MSKTIVEILYEITKDWNIAHDMKVTIPKEVLKSLAEEWSGTKEKKARNPYFASPFEIRDERNSGRKKQLQALTVKTSFQRSAPRSVRYYAKTSIKQSWASRGIEVGNLDEHETYISKDFVGFDFEHEIAQAYKAPVIRHKRRGWAVIELENKTDSDDYDWPVVSHEYIIALI